MDAGLLLVRVIVGGVMAAHGAQKLFGWFGGYGLTGTGGFFDSMGFRPGKLFAGLAGGAETLGGLLVAFGLLGPIGPALVLSVMVVAALTVHAANGLFAQNNGIEVPLLYATVAVGLGLTGYGAYSLDAALGLASVWTTGLSLAVLVLNPASVLAQEQTGGLQGRVLDSSRGALPGVTVTVSGPTIIGGTLTTVTGETGIYRIANIPLGTYIVSFELPGFQSKAFEGIRVQAGAVFTLDAELGVATVEETITVSGETPILDTASTNVSFNFTKELMCAKTLEVYGEVLRDAAAARARAQTRAKA